MNESKAHIILLIYILIILTVVCTIKQTPTPYQHKAEPSSQRTVLASRGGSSHITKTFVITAYTAGYESTGKREGDAGYGVTASGSRLKEGDCACGQDYAFGTHFQFDGGRRFTCVDRGGDIGSNHIDIYIPRLDDALKFGRQVRDVTVVEGR